MVSTLIARPAAAPARPEGLKLLFQKRVSFKKRVVGF